MREGAGGAAGGFPHFRAPQPSAQEASGVTRARVAGGLRAGSSGAEASGMHSPGAPAQLCGAGSGSLPRQAGQPGLDCGGRRGTGQGRRNWGRPRGEGGRQQGVKEEPAKTPGFIPSTPESLCKAIIKIDFNKWKVYLGRTLFLTGSN